MTSPPPESARQPLVRAPAIVLVSLALLVLIHLATLLLSLDAYNALIDDYGFVPAHVLTMGASAATTLWVLATFVTYAFLHANFTHLAVNGLSFLIFATVVARRIGSARFVVFSLVTAVVAALAHLATNWGDATAVIGASGAISGYMGGAARFMFLDPRSSQPAGRPLLPLSSRPVAMFALVWTVANVGFGATGFSPDGSSDLTAWQAHLGGFFSGLLLFPLFDQRRYWLG